MPCPSGGGGESGALTNNRIPVGNEYGRLIVAGVVMLLAGTVQAAVGVDWEATGGLNSGESVVNTDGTLQYAYNVGNATTYTINTVPFKGTAAGAVADLAGEGNVLWTPADNGGSVNFSDLAGDFGSMMDSASWGFGNTSTTITLKNLVEGQSYIVQVFSSDTRAGRSNTLVLDSGTGNEYSSVDTGAVNSGAHVTGTFVADATQQATFTFRYLATSGNANINAIQVRKLARTFVHPGIPLTVEDLDAIKANLAVEPWKTGYDDMVASQYSSLSYVMEGPFAQVGRSTNNAAWEHDMTAVHNLARMWYFTGDAAYAQKGRNILISWASTHTEFLADEVYLSMGYHAWQVFEGADILRGTWPGWSEGDTAICKAYFENVWWNPIHVHVPHPLRSANQGAANLLPAIGVAIFNDDEEKFEQCLQALRADPCAALPSSLPNGQIGDSGRDAHSQGQLKLLAWAAEVFWKQGVDVFAEHDNRLLAAGEYFSRVAMGFDTPFVTAGTVYDIYPDNNSLVPANHTYFIGPDVFYVLHGAYVVRKGMSAPYLEKYLSYFEQNADSFCYLKVADTSTAVAPLALTAPAGVDSVTSLSGVNMGDNIEDGDQSYSSGTWSVSGKGERMSYNTADPDYRFAYLSVTGNATIIAQITGLTGGSATDARAGLVFNASTGNNDKMAAVVITAPDADDELQTWYRGETAHSHDNGSPFHGKPNQPRPRMPYWLKIERIGDRISLYTSPDGASWSTAGCADYDNLAPTAYYGLAVSSDETNNAATATFTDVRITGGDGGEPIEVPAPPFAIYASPGGDQVPLRWLESFEATSYRIHRSTQPGGPYTQIAEEAGTSHVDTNVVSGTHYYYAVSAANAMGESAFSPEVSFHFRPTYIEAEDFDANSGNQALGGCADWCGGDKVGYISNDDWCRYDNIQIGTGGVFRARVASGSSSTSGRIDVYLDAIDGTLVASLDVPYTGDWSRNWETVEAAMSPVSGTHSVFLKFVETTSSGITGGSLFDVNWFDITYPAITEYDLGMDLSITYDPAAHALVNRGSITAWDSTATHLNITDGSDLSNVDFAGLGITSWTTSDFGDLAKSTVWDGVNLNGIVLYADNNFGAGDNFKGAEFSNLTWGTATSTADAGRFFSGGSGATSAADRDDAISFLGADLSLISDQARSVMINNLGGFDGGTPIGARFDPAFLENSGWDKAELLAGGWQYLAVDAFATIEGEDYDDQMGISTQSCSEGGLNVQAIQNGDWCAYYNVDFGNGADEFQARVASETSGGNIEIRLDGPAGDLVGTCIVNGTGHWQTWVTVTTNVSGVSGVHDLYLVFTGGPGYLFNVNWFTFTPAPATYTLTYTAGAGGTITGTSPQMVDHGNNGSPVTAEADANYSFVNWSDGSTANPRTDVNVTGNLTVLASFVEAYTDLENWRFANFGTFDNAGNAADDFDADFDGILNLLEYATGTDPNTPGGSPLSIGPATVGSGMELTFNQIADPTLNYFIEGKDDLGSGAWDPVWSGTGTSEGTVTIPDSLWPSDSPRYFFRLGVNY